MVHLALVAEPGDLAGKDAAFARHPDPFHEGGVGVEPLEGDGTAVVRHQGLEEPPSPLGGRDSGRKHLSGKNRARAGLQTGNGGQLAAILVAVRQQVHGVLDGRHAAFLQQFREFRSDPLDELHAGLEVLAGDGLLERRAIIFRWSRSHRSFFGWDGAGTGFPRRTEHNRPSPLQLDGNRVARPDTEMIEKLGGDDQGFFG